MVKTLLAKRLKKGDTIGIVAPSGSLIQKDKPDYRPYLENFRTYAEGLGFNVIYSKNLFNVDEYGIAAGTPQERADDFNEMFANKKVHCVWCFTGGDLGNQILDLIDYKLIKKNPKIILGKSDIDVFLMGINKVTGLVTFHSPDAKIGRGHDLEIPYSQKYFIDRLMKRNKDITPTAQWKTLREGKATGKLIGCNLSSILKLNGTQYFPDFKGSILFLETYKKEVGALVAALEQLKQIGVFDHIKGIVIGHIYGFEDQEKYDGQGKRISYEDIVLSITKEYSFPIMKIQEFGHYCPNAFIPIGATVAMDATKKTLRITSPFLK